MRISTTDKEWIARKISQFEDTALFADTMDVSTAKPETIKSVLTDLVRIVRDYCVDLGKEVPESNS